MPEAPVPETRSRAVPDRWWQVGRLVLALLTLTAVVVQAADLVARDLPLTNFFSYFTIQSNLVGAAVLAAAAVVGLRGGSQERLAGWRGAATLYLGVTGVVYLLLLRDVDVQTSEPWINAVLHYLMPLALLVDWLARPPAGLILRRAAWWAVYPLLYVAYSLVRGAAVDWYPYPFLDPRAGGYGPVAVTALVILVAAAALGAALVWLARATRRDGPVAAGAPLTTRRPAGPRR